MKPHGLVARDGEDAAAQGLTGSLPCSLTASNIWEISFEAPIFVTSVVFLQGGG